ncbi:MAG: ribonuclease HII [Weeksellaceae bacterium]|nr:ribonuclease HII [Weeksellaceae bacterium]
MELQYKKAVLEAGCDEAGRGCLAGPVFAAAVVIDKDFDNELINDSKQISENKRIELRKYIEEQAVDWSVAYVESIKIDEINILNASILAMHLALDGLQCRPEFISVDGNRFKKYRDISHQCVVKGDALYRNIAAASILAKTYRDEFMQKLDRSFPVYQWAQNKGYPTAAHRKAIQQYGITEHHRKSFRLLPQQYELDL